MKSICSHTLVKNGMPFIGRVLRQVAPYMNRCIVTVSKRSDSETTKQVLSFKKDFGDKVTILEENVSKPGYLTYERQKMVDQTDEDWILFLDDDDYWPQESLENCISLLNLNNHIDGFACQPIQIVDRDNMDWSWRYKWFTKWFPNASGLHYVRPWPEDIIMIQDRPLYWRQNSNVLRVPFQFFHLSQIKDKSFRDEYWARSKGWVREVGDLKPIPEKYKKYVKEIYGD